VGSVPGRTIVTAGGVTIIGAGDLASDLPGSASQMYARNVVAVIASLMPEGVLAFDPDDEVHRSIVVCTGGELVSPAIRAAVGVAPTTPEKKEAFAS
jgi:NAD(P) transhydrogenase subunit alpha